ncbi:MAG: hypothetical protein AUI14_01110 [Actinobacteria bacterium 13_2_20CM_2_71_6]|nr:MAG: hypothetical protein AUI14_01110 [Actinobacteria bacterium 13_2_20CM_2_71_6]
MRVPDPFQQFLAGHHGTARLRQLLQDAELLAGQLQRLAGPGDRALGLVEDEIPDGQYRRGGRRRAPAQGPYPRYQLVKGERLGQVVVGAQPQPLDPVGDGTAGGQHQHPGQRAGGDQIGADVVPRYTGQVPVEHHHVVPGDEGHLVPARPVVRDIDGHAFPAQPPGDRLGQIALVLHHQDPHARLPVSSRCTATRLWCP